jgi:hypothetical protein
MMERVFDRLNQYFGHFELAVLDLEKAKRWSVVAKPESIAYLKRENAHDRHILIKPVEEMEPYFMMVDDLDAARIAMDHKVHGTWKPGRMCVETSPKNFQVWIRSARPLSLDEKRHWLKLLGNDPGADPNGRWGRCPGFRNRKEKYRDENGGYPLSRLIWVDWRSKAEIPEVVVPGRKVTHGAIRDFNDGGGVWAGDISRSDYERGDESATDFAYALALFRRGCSDEEICQRIRAERDDWANHVGERRIDRYLARTVERAWEQIDGQGPWDPTIQIDRIRKLSDSVGAG